MASAAAQTGGRSRRRLKARAGENRPGRSRSKAAATWRTQGPAQLAAGPAVTAGDADRPAVLDEQALRGHVIERLGAAATGPAQHLEEQAFRVGQEGVVPEDAAGQTAAIDRRRPPRRLRRVEHAAVGE